MSATAAGNAAKTFTLLATDGQPRTLGKRTGGPLVVAFFKTDCPTCMLLFPYLQRLYEAYRDQGLQVWGVSQDPLDSTLAFATDCGVAFPVLLDTTWEASNAYGIDIVPTVMLFDREGAITFMCVSFCKADVNEIALQVSNQTGSPAVVVARDDDGKPHFRPG